MHTTGTRSGRCQQTILRYCWFFLNELWGVQITFWSWGSLWPDKSGKEPWHTESPIVR